MGASTKYIGSSDGPPILGVPSYGLTAVDVWDRLMGFDTGRKVTADMSWGQRLEPLILAAYTEATGRKLDRRHRRYYVKGHPYIGCTIDARADDRLVEAKFSPWERDYGEPADGPEGLPLYVRVQVQHQMLVTGATLVDVPVLLRGYDLRIFEVPRDDAFLEDYGDELVEWHEKYIVGKTPPPLDDSESYERHLRRRHHTDDGTTIEAPASLRPVFRQLAEGKRDEKLAKHRIRAARSILMATMGDATKLVGKDITITWRSSRPSAEVAWDLVAIGFRKMLEEARTDRARLDAVESLYTTFSSTRRFLPKYEGELAEIVKLTPQDQDEEVSDADTNA